MRKFALAAVLFFLGGVPPRARRDACASISLEKCTLCHGKPEYRKLLVDGQIRDLFVIGDTLAGSVHGKKGARTAIST